MRASADQKWPMRLDAARAAPRTTVGSRSKDLEPTRDHMITSRLAHRLPNGRHAAVITASNKQGERLCIDPHTERRFQAARFWLAPRPRRIQIFWFWPVMALYAGRPRRGVASLLGYPSSASVPVGDPRAEAHVSEAGVPGRYRAHRLTGSVNAVLAWARLGLG
jgi:hypothetical protein